MSKRKNKKMKGNKRNNIGDNLRVVDEYFYRIECSIKGKWNVNESRKYGKKYNYYFDIWYSNQDNYKVTTINYQILKYFNEEGNENQTVQDYLNNNKNQISENNIVRSIIQVFSSSTNL